MTGIGTTNGSVLKMQDVLGGAVLYVTSSGAVGSKLHGNMAILVKNRRKTVEDAALSLRLPIGKIGDSSSRQHALGVRYA